MRNNKNSSGENVILFLVAIGVFAIIGGFAGCWSGSDDDDYAAGVDDAIDDDDEDW